jgi:hypothetical protein
MQLVPPLSRLQQASGLGGEKRGEREQIRPCTRCSLPTFSFALCLSFSYLRSAVEASFDTRKAHGKPYTDNGRPPYFYKSRLSS